MAIPFSAPADFMKNEILNAVFQNLSTAPASPKAGQYYYNTSEALLYYYNGTKWVSVSDIADKAVTNVKLADMPTMTIKGNILGTASAPQDLTATSVRAMLNVADGANNYVHPASHAASMITQDATHRFTTDAEKAIWDAKAAITPATQTTDGLLSCMDKIKLDSLGSAAFKVLGTGEGQVPILGVGGKLDVSILPATAISDTFVISSQTAMLALTAQVGDVAVRTDLKKSYILKTEPASALANWQELLTPTDAVASVNGKTGTVSLTTTDISEGTNKYFTDDRVSAASIGITPAQGSSNLGTVVGLLGSLAYAIEQISGDAHWYTAHADSIAALKTLVNARTRKYAQSVGTGTLNTFSVPHNFNTTDVIVQIFDIALGKQVYSDVSIVDANNVSVNFSVAPTTNQYRVVVIG